MISEDIKDPSYYNQNKKKFNKMYNREWKKIAGPKFIGLCSYLFQHFYKEWCQITKKLPEINDFAKYYFSHSNPIESEDICREDSKEFGRSVEELTRLAKHYQKVCGDYTIPLEQYFDDIVNHAIVETYYGQMREIMLIKEYESKGFTAKHTNGKWDKDFGVDFIIYKDGIIKDYIQCKPISTFIGNSNSSLMADRVNFFHKESDKQKECIKKGMPYYKTKFVMYHSEHPKQWCHINGKRGFYLEELTDRRGYSKINLKDIVYK